MPTSVSSLFLGSFALLDARVFIPSLLREWSESKMPFYLFFSHAFRSLPVFL